MGLISTGYSIIRDIGGYLVGRVREPRFEVTNTRSIGSFNDDRSVNTVTYQVLVENIGRETAHECTSAIYFHGTRREGEEEVTAEITVDTRGCWSQAGNPAEISLHAGDAGWVDVFRLVEDYRSGPNFDIHEDRHIEFPTANGWDRKGEIQFQHIGMDVSRSDTQMTRKAVWQTYWEEAHLGIRSEEDTMEYPLDFEDMNSKMDNSPLFSEDSFNQAFE